MWARGSAPVSNLVHGCCSFLRQQGWSFGHPSDWNGYTKDVTV